MTKVLLFGSTGLVGRHCLNRLLADPRVIQVIAPARSAVSQPEDPSVLPKLVPIRIELDRLSEIRDRIRGVDVAISCLGTTLKSAGSREAFRKIDHDFVVAAARLAKDSGVKKMIVVSSVGADAGSKNFYLKTKGEAEASVRSTGVEEVHAFRPSLLLGARNESRPGEALAQKVAPWASPLLFGPLARYRPIDADTLARAIVRVALEPARKGFFVHEGRELGLAES